MVALARLATGRPWPSLHIALPLFLLAGCAKPAPATMPVPPEGKPVQLPARTSKAERRPGASETTPPVEAPIEGYTDEIAKVLAARWVHWTSYDTRVALARRGALRFSPDGVAFGLDDDAPFADPPRLAVLEDGPRPRVIVDAEAVRLLVHVEREDAKPVVIESTPLARNEREVGRAPGRRGYAILHPGAWVDVADERDQAIFVEYRGHDRKLMGWVDMDRLGTTVTIPASPSVDSDRVWVARRASQLSTSPGGKGITKVDEEEVVVAIGKSAEGGYRRVEYQPQCVHDFSWVGWVPARDLFQPNYGSVHGCGHGGGSAPAQWGDAADAPRTTLPAGRFLLEPGSRRVVGCVREPAEVADLGSGVYAIPTSWGPVTVHLAPDGFDGACAVERPRP